MKIRETHRIVVMGGGGVGKTSLVTQFMQGFFVSSYKPTVEDYYRHTVKTPGREVRLRRQALTRTLDSRQTVTSTQWRSWTPRGHTSFPP